MTDFTAIESLMRTITHMDFHSRPGPGSLSGWAGHGHGQVSVASARTPAGESILRFHEQGEFTPEGADDRGMPFHNVYRWTFLGDRLALHHERRGADEAVWLFDLVADARHEGLISASPHPCGEDSYRACLTAGEHGFELEWIITGPVKNEHLYYRYEGTRAS
ncbi:hypothetical protein C7446_2589 [Kushneria sinocarnis]|uniref:DUF6314 domain-containing protein n=2 Tax=Kushneria sinocarnis TaxID=595502 RepID=A0A420WUN3_9GAMM|nr:hypothetical protein C7446_2589 [Kushneria sinocarnis]